MPFVLAGLYALHRFCLRLEEPGYLYNWRKKPKGGGASMFMPLQEFLEPQMNPNAATLHGFRYRQSDNYSGAPTASALYA
jgi:hypothetical protein